MTYLRNCWYMAGWSDEIGASGILARSLLDQPVVMFRDEDGEVHALDDRCPHRFVPLSLGEQVGDSLQCRYHGLRFGGDGSCTANPHGPVTGAMRVRSYPVIERNRSIWIWMGEAKSVEAGKLRDLDFLGSAPETAFSQGYVNGAGSYQLFVDNILDLTHVDFLHPDTLGGGAITRTRASVEERDGAISVAWRCLNEVPAPLIAQRLPPGVDRVDSWVEVEWTPPSVLTLRSGAVPAGAPREGAGEVTNVHVLTPETATTCHYFYAATRNYAVDDQTMNERTRAVRDRIFSTEDEPMVRAQALRMGNADFWDLKPLLLRIDEGAVRVRRTLDALIAAEQVSRSSPTAAAD